ncbi:MAG TPA: bifunctional phosphopantothenoylcysteine decarboxylase/phosphopantothenate--cysteine ligase CoaBC [Myxococcales bacterium]|jgi:phosphopantothenoylcysteine decarboxylase / phosphopantothenate---cysteine ligase|nr:bifunctional phosphopantothenoylcysteine decarboxylase/phosphopantothenate--cysteine ligase CoaBC [Myxococcales bacterium]
MERVRGRRILLCVGGGIAAYKACEIARVLVKAGAEVRPALTPAAQRFVSALTFQALTGRPAATDLWDAAQELAAGHIALADWAELALVAPATADLLARTRAGLGDEVVTATLLAVAPSRMLFAPAMNERMWASPAVADNVAVLRERGARFVGPAVGEMAERSHSGPGRLAEAPEVARAAAEALAQLPHQEAPRDVRDLGGVPVLVTAGPTREALDPVRFLSNPSTGRMGFALAEAARDRGARVTLIVGPTQVAPPPGVEIVRIVTAAELAEQVSARADAVRVIAMAAAVSDQRPAHAAPQKVKKQDGDEMLRLVRTPDILAGLGARFSATKVRPLLVGFAAETERVEENARAKLSRKQLDFIVANDVSADGAGFASTQNRVVVFGKDGLRVELSGSKLAVAHGIWDRVRERLSQPDGAA